MIKNLYLRRMFIVLLFPVAFFIIMPLITILEAIVDSRLLADLEQNNRKLYDAAKNGWMNK